MIVALAVVALTAAGVALYLGEPPEDTVAHPAGPSGHPVAAPLLAGLTSGPLAGGGHVGTPPDDQPPAAVPAPRVLLPAPKPAVPASNRNKASAAVGLLIQGRADDAVSVAALNTVTGASFSAGAASGMTEGSLMKLDLLETLLLQHQDAGTWLDDDETSAATAMIVNSDNDAGTFLYWRIGRAPALQAANARLGLTDTVLASDYEWGLATTNAADQLALLKDLAGGGPLSVASRTFALDLMQRVESDQAWGVSAAADPGSVIALKNGWLGLGRDDGLWLTNSVGVITVHGQPVLIAVMTQHNPSFEAGVELVESFATALLPAVTS
ncbi:MAG: serine hydrolase [Actinomycetota bacterium]